MSWKPKTSHQIRLQRAKMYQSIRQYFLENNVLEVETPALSQAANTDPFIESFQINNKDLSKRYLHTSPEYPMKRLLADGSGDIYQIMKVWREGEAGRNHNPEFTMLEWYRVGFTYHQLINDVSILLHTLLGPQNTNLITDDKIVTYHDLFLDKFGFNPHIVTLKELVSCVEQNISGLSCEYLNHQALLDALLTHCIEPDFSKTCLTFITDYPASQSALAQLRDVTINQKSIKTGGGVFNKSVDIAYKEGSDQPISYSIAERFEVYLGTMELGNGYQEETFFQRNKNILQDENSKRNIEGLTVMPEDEYFLQACKAGIPRSAGVAIGLDRVLMCISGVDSIQKVINFPWDVA